MIFMMVSIRPFNLLSLSHHSLKLPRKFFDWGARVALLMENRIDGITLIKKLNALKPVKSVHFINIYVYA